MSAYLTPASGREHRDKQSDIKSEDISKAEGLTLCGMQSQPIHQSV